MSDRGLAKNCAQMRVPVPGRGYWAKKAVGKNPARTPLPDLPPNSSVTPKDITLTIVSSSESDSASSSDAPAAPAPVPEPVALQNAYEAEAKNRITVPATLRVPHRLTQRTLESLDADAHHPEPDWQYKPEPRLAIDVSKPLLKRAIRIMDALVKALDRREWKLTISRRGEDRYQARYATYVSVLGHSICIGIREPTGRVRDATVPTGRAKYREERTGRLALTIYTSEDKVEREIVETEGVPLEHRLNDFVIEIVSLAHKLSELHRERLAEWERERVELQRREEERRRREDDAARMRALERQANEWAISVNLLAYVAELRAVAQSRPEGVESGSELAAWLDWAEAHAKARDPFARPLEKLASERVPAPDPYAVRPVVQYAPPPVPHWFNRNR
jgi:hypothetical protein